VFEDEGQFLQDVYAVLLSMVAQADAASIHASTERKRGAPDTGEHTKAARLLACLLGQHQNHLRGKNSGKLPDDAIFASSFPQFVFCGDKTAPSAGEHGVNQRLYRERERA